jgi:hypothetical protein
MGILKSKIWSSSLPQLLSIIVLLPPVPVPRGLKHTSTAARLLRSWIRIQRLRWSRGLHAGLWYPRSRVRSRPKPSDFFCWKNPQHAVRYDTNANLKSNTRTMRHKILKKKKIPPGAWMFVFCAYCVLSGRGLYDELITRREKSYRLWRVAVWSRNLVNETIARAGLQSQRT